MNTNRCVLLTTMLACVQVAFAAAPQVSPRRIAERMLAVGNQTSPSATAELAELNGKLSAAAPRDRRNALVYATALLAQRKYRDVRTVVEASLKTHPQDVEARILKIRASLGEQRTAELMADIDHLVQAFDTSRVGSMLEPTRLEVARFLGVLFAYVDLARPDLVEPSSRTVSKNRVFKWFSETELAAFDDARNGAATSIADLRAQMVAEQRRIERIGNLAADAARSNLADATKQLSDHEEVAQSSQESATASAREASVLSSQLETLCQERARVGARFVALQTQLQMITTPTTSTSFEDRTTPGDRRPVVTTTATTTSVPIDRLAQANAVSLQLAAVNKQALDMDRKILAMQSRLAEVSGEFDRSRETLQDTDAASREIGRKAKIAEQKLKRPPKVSKARLTALRAQLNNFSTYAPFDYEAERKRVLSLFDE